MLHRTLPTLKATLALAMELADRAQVGDVIALDGPLGAGKTELARAFIRAAGGRDEEVPSPTFTLVQIYDLPRYPVWHFDLYRLEQPPDLWELGWEDARVEAVCLIEWPDRAGGLLPEDRLTVRFSLAGASDRNVTLLPGPSWHSRLTDLQSD